MFEYMPIINNLLRWGREHRSKGAAAMTTITIAPEFVDDRTQAQKQTHTMLVIGTDKVLSGWGRARGGASIAAWACEPCHMHAVQKWVEGRTDMKRVRVVSEVNWRKRRQDGGATFKRWRPRPHSYKHCHVYVVTAGHPSLEK